MGIQYFECSNTLQNVFSYYRMCSSAVGVWASNISSVQTHYKPTCFFMSPTEHILSNRTHSIFMSSTEHILSNERVFRVFYRTHSVVKAHIQYLESFPKKKKERVFSHYRVSSIRLATRVCSLTTECVLLLQNVFFYYRMCSIELETVDTSPVQTRRQMK